MRFTAVLGTLFLSATAQAASVTLLWDYNVNTHIPTTYNIYRQENCTSTFTKIGSVPYDTRRFVDATVQPNKLYCWYTTAYDDATGEESTSSNVYRFQVPQEQLSAPLNLHKE